MADTSTNTSKIQIIINHFTVENAYHFWENTLNKGYLDSSDIFAISETAYNEHLLTFIGTFSFFFALFWVNFIFLNFILRPKFFTE